MASMHPPPDLRPARLNALGEFAASIAHEVKQPLAAVKLNAEACLALLAQDPPRVDEARAALRVLTEASVAAGDMVRSLHAMARRAEPEHTPFLIDDAVREALRLMRAELRRHDIALSEHYGLEGIQLCGDRVQLMQALMNLVRNAIEARPRRLTLRTALAGGAARISVADDGAGVPAALAERIYEPLFSTKPDGTGMGLAICRGIAEAHGGRLWHSREAGDTAFHLSFKEHTLWTPSRS
ncbi:signal transduction histidine kinase [Duganella sp. SG902]|uniref:sensor histidine kinase n=1 Tax=Duganella sp. SG902 TaxID=2587016 RepID=UPI00159D70FD|nr:ATP-binding protein [Duganella sp. SG902]NVM79825.1 signal transduction histidine kinase [Duganella sp. SG902]